MGVFAQLHLHTSETSRCGIDCGADMARACKRAGYDIVVVTDHFFNANIDCNRKAPLEEKIDVLYRGYEAAKREGDRIGLKVFFGWETNNHGPEILTYGLDREFLMNNPDIALVDEREYLKRVRAAGAFTCFAHPYRQAYYIPPFTPIPSGYDAVEVYNAGNQQDDWNREAERLCKRYQKIALAGSDAHDVSRVRYGAVELPWPVDTMADLIKTLKTGRAKVHKSI